MWASKRSNHSFNGPAAIARRAFSFSAASSLNVDDGENKSLTSSKLKSASLTLSCSNGVLPLRPARLPAYVSIAVDWAICEKVAGEKKEDYD